MAAGVFEARTSPGTGPGPTVLDREGTPVHVGTSHTSGETPSQGSGGIFIGESKRGIRGDHSGCHTPSASSGEDGSRLLSRLGGKDFVG